MTERPSAGKWSLPSEEDEVVLSRQEYEREQLQVLQHCEPIYLIPKRGGKPGKDSESATVTYIKFQGQTYALTCAHVADSREGGAEEGEILIPTVFGRAGIGFAFREGSKHPFAGLFRTPPLRDNKRNLDIAIAPLNNEFVDAYMQAKNKVALDLDGWVAPDWSKIGTCAAFGFPKGVKSSSEHSFSAEMMTVNLRLTTPISGQRKEFVLRAELDNPDWNSLSGMSGCPIFCRYSDGQLLPIGLVYEGTPGEARDGNALQPGPHGYAFQIHAHLLTPVRFEEWLRELRLLSGPTSAPPELFSS
jgi:hypothetical protein